jgi:hypothetical protein
MEHSKSSRYLFCRKGRSESSGMVGLTGFEGSLLARFHGVTRLALSGGSEGGEKGSKLTLPAYGYGLHLVLSLMSSSAAPGRSYYFALV